MDSISWMEGNGGIAMFGLRKRGGVRSRGKERIKY